MSLGLRTVVRHTWENCLFKTILIPSSLWIYLFLRSYNYLIVRGSVLSASWDDHFLSVHGHLYDQYLSWKTSTLLGGNIYLCLFMIVCGDVMFTYMLCTCVYVSLVAKRQSHVIYVCGNPNYNLQSLCVYSQNIIPCLFWNLCILLRY